MISTRDLAAFAAILVVSTLVGENLAMDPDLLDHNLQSHGALMERAGQLPNWISLIGLTDRNLHNWWIDYNNTWTGYNKRLHEHDSDPDEFYCPNHAELNRTLVNLWKQADLVRSGVEEKLKQVGKIRATLEDPGVIGTTGFHCGRATRNGTDISNTVNLTQANMPPKTVTLINTICQSIKNLTDIAKDEAIKINKEIRQVEIEIEIIKQYVCDCTYYDWTEHETSKGTCSKKCGNGTMEETRVKKWEKKGASGLECSVADGKRTLPCNEVCCPHACTWHPWGEWKACSDSCDADTKLCRQRTKNISNDCPSTDTPRQDFCTGDMYETISTCSNIRGKKDEIDNLESELAASNATLSAAYKKIDHLIALLCPEPCINGGECIDYKKCQCQLGFSGATCETPSEVTCSTGGKCKSDKCLTDVTLTTGTTWKQPFCSEDRCLTYQLSGPGVNICENNTDGMDREINGVDNVKWCHGKKVRTECQLSPVTTTTTTSTTTTVITTTTIPTTTTAISYNIVEGGCYEDRVLPNSKRERMLTGDYAYLTNNSLSACRTFCQKFNYFGVQNTYDCFCGSIIHHLTKTSQSECNEDCPGESSQKCGGSYRQNLYSKNSPEATGSGGTGSGDYSGAEFNAFHVGGVLRYGKTMVVDLRNDSLSRIPVCDWTGKPYPHDNEKYSGGAVIPYNDTLMPVLCGGQRAYDKCYGYKYHSGEWELVNTMPKSLGYLSMVSIGKGWMFVAGGEDWKKRKASKSTYLLNADGDIINGPDLDDAHGLKGACPAIISDNGDTKVIALLGGCNANWECQMTMRRFQCSFHGSTPSCLQLSNGPDMPFRKQINGRELRQFSCGVLRSEDGKDVLYAWAKHGDFAHRALDLSTDGSTWQELPLRNAYITRHFVFSDGSYNFITNKNKTIGYLFGESQGIEGMKVWKITSKSPTDITVEKKSLQKGDLIGKDNPTIFPVPNDKYFCP